MINEMVRAVMAPVQVVGAHTVNATLSAAVTLTAPALANAILIGVETKSIRVTFDGTTPTAATGFLLAAGDWVLLRVPALGAIKVIQVEATATIQYQWLKEGGGVARQ